MATENIKDTIGSLLGQSGRLIGNLFDSNLRNAGLDVTVEQWIILLNLYERDGLSQKELADKVHKNKASINSVLNQLQKKGFIQRLQQEGDKRLNSIRLTSAGKKLKAPLFKIAHKSTQQFTTGINETDIKLCNSVLRRIIANVQKN